MQFGPEDLILLEEKMGKQRKISGPGCRVFFYTHSHRMIQRDPVLDKMAERKANATVLSA
jgi:hypothetical protein